VVPGKIVNKTPKKKNGKRKAGVIYPIREKLGRVAAFSLLPYLPL
jgi:hypothetical protein